MSVAACMTPCWNIQGRRIVLLPLDNIFTSKTSVTISTYVNIDLSTFVNVEVCNSNANTFNSITIYKQVPYA